MIATSTSRPAQAWTGLQELRAEPHTDAEGRWLAGVTSLLHAAQTHLTAAGVR